MRANGAEGVRDGRGSAAVFFVAIFALPRSLTTSHPNIEVPTYIVVYMVVGLIALVAVVAITSAGSSVNTIFTNIAAELAKAA